MKKFFKVFVVSAVLFTGVCGLAVAEEDSNWHKIFLVAPEFLYNNQKVENISGDNIRMNSCGVGASVGYLSANKDNGFALSFDISTGGMFTNDITSSSESGFFTNTYAGAGFAPIRTEKFLLAITGGIGVDNYNYIMTHKDTILAGMNFLGGVEVAFTAKLSKHFGISAKMLGTVAVVGAEFFDGNTKTDNDGSEKALCIAGGSFSVKPSVGMVFQF